MRPSCSGSSRSVIRSERDGRRIEEDVFLGVVVSSTLDEVAIPFIGAGTPVEYELTRSIRTVSSEERLTLGILRTDADVIGPSREWQIVTELKQQYNVEEIFPDSEIDENKYDVVIAVLPSSLTEPQMANLVDYVRKGMPVLIFDDPFPMVFNSFAGVSNAPRQPKPSPGGGMMGMQQRQPPVPKADDGKATSLLNVMQIAWEYDEVVFDYFNPHPEFYAVVPPEYLFVSPQSGVASAFNTKSEITNGLAGNAGRLLWDHSAAGRQRPEVRTAAAHGPKFRAAWMERVHHRIASIPCRWR